MTTKRARLAARVRRTWTVLLSLGTVFGLGLAFQRHGYDPGGDNRFDAWLLVAMGGAYLFAAVHMVVLNEEWPLQAHGQLLTYLGDAGIWGLVGLTRVGWRHPITTEELTWIRSAFVVGVACLVLGLLLFDARRSRGWRRGRWPGFEREAATS